MIQEQFNFYHTYSVSKPNFYYDCLQYKVFDDIVNYTQDQKYFRDMQNLHNTRQIISYCIRPIENMDDRNESIVRENVFASYTFEELNEQNVTFHQLLLWSAPMDLIELYQNYVEKLNSSLGKEKFYNCTKPWFGTLCQYTFDLDTAFSNIVKTTFLAKKAVFDVELILPKIVNLSCYIYLECNRGPEPLCLDWREICDGQIDCIGTGIDEMNCLELEIYECESNEYRCHNGMCIPKQFFNDNPFNPDCLDSTDENDFGNSLVRYEGFPECYKDPAFRCEEASHSISELDFACGDGQQTTLYTKDTELQIDLVESICLNGRNVIVRRLLPSTAEQTNLTYDCWRLMRCLAYERFTHVCGALCGTYPCHLSIESKCNTSDYIISPAVPIFQGHVRFGYWTNRTATLLKDPHLLLPHFVCYDEQRCPFFASRFEMENYTCLDPRNIGFVNLIDLEKFFGKCLPMVKLGNETHCFYSTLFHCPNTLKCISKHRLVDGRNDCFDISDETYAHSCQLKDRYRFQCSSENKCISSHLVRDGHANCRNSEDELSSIESRIIYQNLCNGYTHSLPILIDGRNETDETNCEEWPCENLYTRCDNAWTCRNGADEINCDPTSRCYPHQHECVSPKTFEVDCLPINRTGDGIIDCLGGMDERDFCRNLYPTDFHKHYRCWNETKCVTIGCQNLNTCSFERKTSMVDICRNNTNIEIILNSFFNDYTLKDPNWLHEESLRYKYFALRSDDRLPLNPRQKQRINTNNISSRILDRNIDFHQAWFCNRGILIYYGKEKTEYCLCPPSYHGDRCQIQSQRVSLTIQFRKECVPNCDGIYAILITLVDENQIIHSYEQLTHVSIKNCDRKYNLYLLYQSRPKNQTNIYSIQIHAYNKLNLIYYTSWILPIKFSFLPVNRMAANLIIPSHAMNCALPCGNHGHCAMFSNTGKQFCRCHSGWSGLDCTMQTEICDCSSDSLCLGIVNNRSICLCPISKFASRCFLHSICQNDTCQNGGQCLFDDDQWSPKAFKCICTLGFSGDKCEVKDIQIDFSFRDLEIPQLILTYFISIQIEDDPLITMLAKKIPFDEESTTIFTSFLFSLIFVRIHHEYYLSFQRTNDTQFLRLPIEVQPFQRCLSIDEVLDKHILAFPLLRRVKYYHVACQKHVQLPCLHDKEMFMCLCDSERFANCFNMNFTKETSCQEGNLCETNGQCFQDLARCPTKKMCVCNPCYYGGQCQFTTKGFSRSLDAILGYQIRRYLAISHQSSAVKTSIIITTIILFISLISGSLSMITFSSKPTREVGCGLYLFVLSLFSILIPIILTIKVWLLIIIQTSWITNDTILRINCIFVDFLLRALLAITDWFSACVAIERTIVVVKGTSFNKMKSKQIARWIVIIVILLNMISIIHDPIYRNLIYDEQEKRTWCIVRYPFALQIFDSFLHIFHFSVPFFINFISAVIIIIYSARTHSNARKQQTYKQHLKEQLQQHRHLIISPFLLMILSLPRLIISFLSGCMKSGRDPWLFLFGYFISFVPAILIPFVFIFPSEMYRKEMQAATQRRLHLRLF